MHRHKVCITSCDMIRPISRGVASQGSKFGSKLQLPFIFFFLFLPIPFLLAGVWLNEIQLVIIRLPVGSRVELQPQKYFCNNSK